MRGLLTSLALCAALSAQASPLPEYPLVSTSGKAQIWLAPDIGELQFDLGAQNASSEEAAAELEALAAAVLAKLAESGIREADIDSFDLVKKTTQLSRPTANGVTQTYSLARHFRVQVRDLSQWPPLIAALLSMDHVESLGVSFDRIDHDRINKKLMAEAAQDARSNGALLAESFGRKLGPAQAISRGPLDKLAAPFGLQEPASAPAARGGASASAAHYAVPLNIPFAQAVHAVFRLK
jgi:uncharacterized protein YggE